MITRALLLFLALGAAPRGQDPAGGGPGQAGSFDAASAAMQKQLDESLAELAELRERIAAEKVPLARQLAELEAELSQVRLAHQQKSRQLDGRALELDELSAHGKALEDEIAYVANLLGEYGRSFESRLHIAELDRYRPSLKAAQLAVENPGLTKGEVFAAQLAVLSASLERLHEAVGGQRFAGSAVDAAGTIHQGTFVLVGPAAIFRSADGKLVGTAEQRLGSLEPVVVPFAAPEDSSAAAQVLAESGGRMPLDPTLGNAHKIEAIQETWWQHVQKGGPVMVPIFVLAGAALLVALYKWLRLSLVRTPAEPAVRELLAAVARRDKTGAWQAARAMPGPAGAMLALGVEHLEQPRELVEEVMYEKVLATRLELQKLLPFIAITASSAPLLGLLGTVTGIMNTFSLMTVFGTGDAKVLSGGISEALITTEYGLYVAIPSLLLHAILSRKARTVVDRMEKTAVALVNQLGKTPYGAKDRLLVDDLDDDLDAADGLVGAGQRARAV